MMIAAVFAASLILVAEPAVETANTAAAAPAPLQTPARTAGQKALEDSDKVVCVSHEVTGTRFPRKECRTKGEWAQLKRDSQDLTSDITTRHQLASPLSGR